MERLERLVVHVEEALYVAETRDDAHQRLSLLMLDSAAELMLHRECEWLLSLEQSQWNHLQAVRRQETRNGILPPELVDEKARLEALVTSNTRRGKIDREFDAKAEFVGDRELLPSAHVRVLRKLHAYRNDAYHRDKVRPATLATAVKIYAYVVCTMMRDLPVHAVGHSWGARMPQALAAFIGDDFGGLLEAQPRVAEALLARIDSGQPGEIAATLSDHLLDRLTGVDEGLAYAAEYLAELRDDPAWDVDAVLHQAQVDDDYVAAFGTPSELKSWRVAVTLEALTALRGRADQARKATEPLAAFSMFADVEDAFEAVEAAVDHMVRNIDEAVDFEIERRRGN